MAANFSKIACILAPQLALQIEQGRHGASLPLLITHPLDSTTVFAVSPALAELGIRAGMAVYQTQQLAPGAQVIPADEQAYHAAHSAIETALRAFSPAIETVSLGEFLIDIRGLEGHHGSDQALAQALLRAVWAASGLGVQVGLAQRRFVAQQAAWTTPADSVQVVPPGQEAAFLRPLPMTALPGLPVDILSRLYLFGLRSLGDLAALRKPAVMRQFGERFSVLYELARGNDPRPLNLDVPPLRVARSLRLPQAACDRATLLHAVRLVSRHVSQALCRRGYHAEAIKLVLGGAKGQKWEAAQALKPPTSDEALLTRIATQLLNKVGVQAPVETVLLSCYPLRSWHLDAHQLMLVEAGIAERQAELEKALALIRNRFGERAVCPAALLPPPKPVPIDVQVNRRGEPAVLTYGGLTRLVKSVENTWRVVDGWWAEAFQMQREYFQVLLPDDSFRVVFLDVLSGSWHLERGSLC